MAPEYASMDGGEERERERRREKRRRERGARAVETEGATEAREERGVGGRGGGEPRHIRSFGHIQR